jgi:Mechanosensitive ion channel, conserved TM helix
MNQPLAAVNVSQSFQGLLNTVLNSLPKILVFIVVLVVGWVIATVIMRLIQAVLHRAHFDRFAQRGFVGNALARSNYDASGLIAKIIYYAVLLLTLQVAFGVFGNNPVSTMLDAIVGWLPKAAVAIVLVVVASAIARVVKDLISAALGGLSYGRFIATAASIAIIALGIIAALDQIGIAAQVTQTILIAVVATIGAILAIGVGGGMVRPMQDRWERMLNAAERETNAHAFAYERGRQDAMNAPARPSGRDVQADEGAPATRASNPAGPGAPGTGWPGSPSEQ